MHLTLEVKLLSLELGHFYFINPKSAVNFHKKNNFLDYLCLLQTQYHIFGIHVASSIMKYNVLFHEIGSFYTFVK